MIMMTLEIWMEGRVIMINSYFYQMIRAEEFLNLL
jgi:hypothetical protein